MIRYPCRPLSPKRWVRLTQRRSSSLFPSDTRAPSALNRSRVVVNRLTWASPCQCGVAETGGRRRKKSVGHPPDRDRPNQVIVIDGDFDDVWCWCRSARKDGDAQSSTDESPQRGDVGSLERNCRGHAMPRARVIEYPAQRVIVVEGHERLFGEFVESD